MTAEAAQKMRRMIELCDTFHLPIINFVDEPGFMIGPDAESAATIRYGMAAVACDRAVGEAVFALCVCRHALRRSVPSS